MEWISDNAGTVLFIGFLAAMAWMHLRPGGHGCGMGHGHGSHRDHRPDDAVAGAPPAVDDGGVQELRVRVRGGYEPDRLVVRAGAPVRLVFRREETAPCSESVVFPDLGRSATLTPFRDVPVELPASEPGEHEFTCQMGMLRGRLVVVPAEVRDA